MPSYGVKEKTKYTSQDGGGVELTSRHPRSITETRLGEEISPVYVKSGGLELEETDELSQPNILSTVVDETGLSNPYTDHPSMRADLPQPEDMYERHRSHFNRR